MAALDSHQQVTVLEQKSDRPIELRLTAYGLNSLDPRDPARIMYGEFVHPENEPGYFVGGEFRMRMYPGSSLWICAIGQ